MRLVYAPRALRDIDDILAYVSDRDPDAAERLSRAIEHTIDVFVRHPLIGVRTDEPNVYRYPLRRYRYAIFYRLNFAAETIEVLRVVRGARIRDLGRVPGGDA